MLRLLHRPMLLLLFGIASVVNAAPCGLAITPTADILAPRELSVSVSTTATQDAASDFSVNSQVGITPWLDAGYDYSLTGEEGLGNFKIGLPIAQGAVAAGLQSINDVEEWYGVYTHAPERLAPLRIHVGILDSSVSDIAPFLGLEYTCCQSVTLMLEGVGGEESYGAVGAAFPLANGIDAMVSGIFGLPDGNQLYAEVGHTFQF